MLKVLLICRLQIILFLDHYLVFIFVSFYYCRVPKEWALPNKMIFKNIWNRIFIVYNKHDPQSGDRFYDQYVKGKTIIFIDKNKPSEDNVNKMYKQNCGDLFSQNKNPRSRFYS